MVSSIVRSDTGIPRAAAGVQSPLIRSGIYCSLLPCVHCILRDFIHTS